MTSVVTAYQYRVYCIYEAAYVNVWGTSAPTLCPNNHTDRAIDTSQTVIINTISNNIVTTQEPTTGKFQSTTLTLNIPTGPPGQISNFDYSFPMDLQIWKSDFFADTANIGDVINGIIAPNSQIGILTSSANIGDTVLNVNKGLVTSIQVTRGVDVFLDDGNNIIAYGRIININSTNNTITVENPLTQTYNSGAMIRMNIRVIKDMILYYPGKLQKVGEKGFKAKLLPANTIIRIAYTNNSGSAKTCIFVLEYYYS
jgi:hypothetical protein